VSEPYVPVRRSHRRRLFIQVVVGVALLVIVAVVIVVIANNNRSATVAEAKAPSSSVGPKNMLSDGILISGPKLSVTRTPAIPVHGKPVATDESKHTSTANIVEYIDYQCPACLAFEETNLGNVAQWVQSGKATLELHPIAFLDRSSEGTRYSSRAANAAACIANYDPDRYIFVAAALYQNQPAEGTTGLTNAKILSVIKTAVASHSYAINADITNCVNTEQFKAWVAAATARVQVGTFAGVALTPSTFQGTPTVFVDGVLYTGSITDSQAFAAFVDKQKPGTTN
jgi:protein-disulfide isomerase